MFGLVFVGGVALGCARTGFPEGGPVDDKPPAVASTFPLDQAVDVPANAQLEIVFDEPLAPGVQAQVRRLVLFNPDKPEVVTNTGGKKIEIQPREPLEPNTTYSIVILPGLPDRRNNVTKERIRLSFSTGGPLTLTILRGTVTAGGKPAPGALVRAHNLERDFSYRTVSDSVGGFELISVAVGKYVVTAWQEANNVEDFQFTLEPGDTAVAAIERIGAGADVALELVHADTSAARMARVEPIARDGIRVLVTDPLPRGLVVDPKQVELLLLVPGVVPEDTPLDSVPQTSIVGDTLPIAQVTMPDTLEPRQLLVRTEEVLADSSYYALRVTGIVNTAGLATPKDTDFRLFRTRVLPDTTLVAAPPPGTPAPAGPPVAPPAQPDRTGAPAAPFAQPDTTGAPRRRRRLQPRRREVAA